ncbi:hypothetical protein T492DRAFT_846698 [Pavlovales sp. CCMP2436]|nr:hypothetical protein T492DRAFT_846698 [Pavlovales sp. CCMP2436]
MRTEAALVAAALLTTATAPLSAATQGRCLCTGYVRALQPPLPQTGKLARKSFWSALAQRQPLSPDTAAASAATLRALRTILSEKLLSSNSPATADSSSPSRAEGDSPGTTSASPPRPITSPVALASAAGAPAPASPSPSSSSADPIPNQIPIFCPPPLPSPSPPNVPGSPGDFELLAAWRIQHPSLLQQFDAVRRNLSYELAVLRNRGFSQPKLTLATQLGPAAAAAAAALSGGLRSNSANEVMLQANKLRSQQ